jgi:hypothetical protein
MSPRQPVIDPWVGPEYCVRKYSVSVRTARRWVKRLAQKYLTYTDDRFKKRGKRTMWRIPLSLLEDHISEFLN